MKLIVMIVSSLFVLSACSTSRQTKPGSDRDKHGCIPSAGYTWSEVRKECVRVFEVGTRLNNAADTVASTAAFAVFSADSSKVELFLPDSGTHPLLRLSGTSWRNRTYELKKVAGKLSLYKKGKRIYQQ